MIGKMEAFNEEVKQRCFNAFFYCHGFSRLQCWSSIHRRESQHAACWDKRSPGTLNISANSPTAGQPLDSLWRSSRVGDKPRNGCPAAIVQSPYWQERTKRHVYCRRYQSSCPCISVPPPGGDYGKRRLADESSMPRRIAADQEHQVLPTPLLRQLCS